MAAAQVRIRIGLENPDIVLAATDEGIWRPTDLGARFLNDLQSEFIVDGP